MTARARAVAAQAAKYHESVLMGMPDSRHILSTQALLRLYGWDRDLEIEMRDTKYKAQPICIPEGPGLIYQLDLGNSTTPWLGRKNADL